MFSLKLIIANPLGGLGNPSTSNKSSGLSAQPASPDSIFGSSSDGPTDFKRDRMASESWGTVMAQFLRNRWIKKIREEHIQNIYIYIYYLLWYIHSYIPYLYAAASFLAQNGLFLYLTISWNKSARGPLTTSWHWMACTRESQLRLPFICSAINVRAGE